jgi:outer membrane receptor protein involved in Fe transport
MNTKFRQRLMASTLFVGASLLATPAFAQQTPGSEEPVMGDEPSEATDETAGDNDQGEIVVTGSRIARPNIESNSPIAVVTGEQVVEQGDITLETYLNTLPQANPAGTTTSNNPGNSGQSNINLRGLGSNRNLVLIDGRRPMVSSSDQTVDLNTIPQGLVERIEVVTGGAGAAYGADAIAGVVNIRLKDNFEGIDLRASYSNSIPETDAREYQISGTIGGNFADGRGNMALSVEYSQRQGLIKEQRPFASQATSTTGTFPTGRYTASGGNPGDLGNPIPQSAINTLFASYGVAAKDIPTQTLLGFNSDGSLFGVGTFNNPRDVANFRYALNSPAAPNLNFFPDFYTYNFDIVNILVLPLERKSAFLRGNYEINRNFDVFVQGGYTEYTSFSALAPTPLVRR